MNPKPPKRETHDSFMARFDLKITPTDREKLDYAYELAKHGHKTQTRDSGERYFEHVRDTAIILVDELGITDVEMIIATLLHDILEDCFLLNYERIKVTFGERTAKLISAVTMPNEENFDTESERMGAFVTQIYNSGLEVIIIKLSDRLHNLRTLEHCSLARQQNKIRNTRDVYFPLLVRIAKKYPKIAKRLEKEMVLATQEIEAKW